MFFIKYFNVKFLGANIQGLVELLSFTFADMHAVKGLNNSGKLDFSPFYFLLLKKIKYYEIRLTAQYVIHQSKQTQEICPS